MERKLHCGNWKKSSELERLCLLVWYSPERYFFPLLFLCYSLLYWGYKPSLFVFLADLLMCESVNVSSCWQVNTFPQNFAEHKHPKAVYLIINEFWYSAQNMAAFLKWSQQFSIQRWWGWIEVSNVQNPLRAMNEYKSTIFIVTNYCWNFAVPRWNSQ